MIQRTAAVGLGFFADRTRRDDLPINIRPLAECFVLRRNTPNCCGKELSGVHFVQRGLDFAESRAGHAELVGNKRISVEREVERR